MNKNKNIIRILGFSGILGGLALFAGDMLLYYVPGSTDFMQNMSNASELRIMISGVTALFATWFYILGVGQMYYALKPVKTIIRNCILICFAGILIAYGIIHAEYIAIAATAKLSLQHNLDMDSATSLAWETNQILRMIVYPVFAVLSILFITQVWKKKTLYPRWIIVFFPLIPFLLQGLICKVLSGSLLIIICGGYFNLMLVMFFIASTIALWDVEE